MRAIDSTPLDGSRAVVHPNDGPVVDDRALADAERLRAVADLGLLDTGDEDPFDRWSRRATQLTGSAAALVSLVDSERSFFKSFRYSDGSAGDGREVPISMSLCREVVVRGEPFIVDDAVHDPRTKDYGAVRAFPVGAYAGIPLRSAGGHVLGSFCVVDPVARTWTDEQIAALEDLAVGVQAELRLRAALHETRRHEGLMAVHQRIHALILEGVPRATVLAELVAGVERHADGLRAHVALSDGGPSEPPPSPVCCDVPIVGTDGVSRGTFALCSDRPWAVMAQDLAYLDQAARLAAIVLERDAASRELRARALALRETEAMFRGAFTDASVGMCLADLEDCRWSQVNPALCALLGYSADQLTGIGFGAVTHPDDIEDNLEGARRLRDGEISVYECEKRYLHAYGHVIWVSLSVSLLRDAAGAPRGFIAQVLDITARKASDAALRASEERFRLMVEGVQDYAILMLDADGHIATWNAGAQRFKGWAADEIIGQHFSVFYPAEDVASGKPAEELEIAAAEGRLEDEGWRVRKDGSRFWANVVITALRDADGTLRGYGKITRDLSERRSAELALEGQRAALADAQAIAQIGSWSWEPETGATEWSAEMYRVFGRDPADGPATAEALFAYLHPDDRDRIAAGYAEAFGAGETFELDYQIVAGTGELRSLHALGRREATGRYVGTVQDTTERMRIERSLVDAEGLLALAFDESPLGMTLSTPDRGLVRLNRAFADMLGYSVDELIADQHPTRFTHPDDHAADVVHVRALLDGDAHNTQWDKRYIHAQGHSVWARVSLSVLRHPDGSPRHLVSQIEDITERRQREAEERALRDVAELVAAGAEPAIVFSAIARQVRELFDASASAVVRFDGPANTGIMLGASASGGGNLAGSTFDLRSATATAEVFRSGLPARVDALALTAADPLSPMVDQFGLTGSVAAPIDVAGELWGAVAAAVSDQRIAVGAELRLERFAHLASLAIANVHALETLEHRAATDPLTAIANHRTFHDRLRSEVERARRYERDLSVVLFDLDHFKAVNDTHGHQTGDRILAEVARRLAAEARDGELVARIGGEEFAWLIPETDEDAAYAAAERMRGAIESTPFDGVGTLTLSAGVCSMPHGRTAEELMHHADRALYRAKDHGRNITLVYTGSPGRG